jgi:hypothetical protein
VLTTECGIVRPLAPAMNKYGCTLFTVNRTDTTAMMFWLCRHETDVVPGVGAGLGSKLNCRQYALYDQDVDISTEKSSLQSVTPFDIHRIMTSRRYTS